MTSSAASYLIMMSIAMGKCSDQRVVPSAVGIPVKYKVDKSCDVM